jgi:6-phosphofructokinase 2
MNITTVTVNPALDKSAKVDGMIPSQKLRCHSIQYRPGGGGVNISRFLKRLELNTNCIVPLGGDTGKYFKELLLEENIEPINLEVTAWTRENLAIVDTQTQLQYRFGMPGNTFSIEELEKIKTVIKNTLNENDLLVLSGSLNKSMPADYYNHIIQSISGKNIKVIIDTSDKPLFEALKEQVFLIKPNQKELAQLAGKSFLSTKEQEAFTMEFIHSERAVFVVVSLGARGAMLASKEGVIYQTTPSIVVKSTIGAGDSMVAGLIYALQKGFTPKEMLKWGVACGAATTMSEGTNLASVDNIKYVMDLLN